VVQTALKLTIEPILEHLFEPSSYGFRPGRGCKDALREVDGLIRGGYTHAVDADIMGYFDHIPHDRMCEQLEQIIVDRRVLSLMRGWLSQEIVGEMESWTPIKGSPQGAVISP
jgi:RNA-directed DNA polymerase